MEWYKTLDINTRINCKEMFQYACGVKFEDLGFMFSFKERIQILHNKLLMEDII
jgi:hypothetical protein